MGASQVTKTQERSWRILLVDDDPDFLAAARHVLAGSRRFKAHVETATDASEAVRLFEQLDPDVVVADYRMAPEDGAELLQRLGEGRPDLKRVLLTGFDRERIRGMDPQSIDLILSKNDLLTELDQRLKELLSPPPT